MSETKELLEATVKGLQEKIVSLQHDLREKEKELEDVNKPVISSTTLDIVNDAVNSALEDFRFDCGMFDYEFELDYDNKITLSNLSFTDNYDIVEAVVISISKQFKIIEDETNK